MKLGLKPSSLTALNYADDALQWARFRALRLKHKLGAFSSVPFPVVNQSRFSPLADKGLNATKKFEAIAARIPEGVRTVVDVGSNNGYFAINLARRGYDVIGYEPVASFVRGANQICEQFDVPNAAFITRGLDLSSSTKIFGADVTLVLSVLHNWVKQADFATAKQILSNIWAKTQVAMFFELANTVDNTYIAGFDTMPPMGKTIEECGQFIQKELLSGLPNARVELIGLMPTDYVNGSARHLFIVYREASSQDTSSGARDR